MSKDRKPAFLPVQQLPFSGCPTSCEETGRTRFELVTILQDGVVDQKIVSEKGKLPRHVCEQASNCSQSPISASWPTRDEGRTKSGEMYHIRRFVLVE